MFRRSFFGDHTEHFVGYDETAHDVDHSESDSDGAESGGKNNVFFKQQSASGKSAENGYAGQGVHTRHQGRMKKRRNFIDKDITDKSRSHKNAQ